MAYASYGSGGTTQPEDEEQRRPAQRPQSEGPANQTAGPSAMQPQQPQTFAQMQQAGQARPAPPSPTRSAVENQLANPSTYGSEDVQRSYGRLSQDIDDDYTQRTRATDEQMARRGLYDSSKAAGALSDLNVGRRSAKTELATQLLDRQAQSAGADRANAIAQAMGYENQQNAQGTAQQALALQGRGLDQSYALGSGQLDLARTGQQQQYGLAQQSQDLSRELGRGGMDLQRQGLAQSGSQFDRSFGLQDRGQAQGFDLQRQQLAQSGNQFDRSYGLQERGQNQQYGLQTQQQELARALGYGGLDLQRQNLAQSDRQFGQDFGLRREGQQQNYGLQREQMAQQAGQFGQSMGLNYAQLNSQSQLGNRGIDAQLTNGRTAAEMQAAALQASLGYAPGGGPGGGPGVRQPNGSYTGTTTGYNGDPAGTIRDANGQIVGGGNPTSGGSYQPAPTNPYGPGTMVNGVYNRPASGWGSQGQATGGSSANYSASGAPMNVNTPLQTGQQALRLMGHNTSSGTDMWDTMTPEQREDWTKRFTFGGPGQNANYQYVDGKLVGSNVPFGGG